MKTKKKELDFIRMYGLVKVSGEARTDLLEIREALSSAVSSLLILQTEVVRS